MKKFVYKILLTILVVTACIALHIAGRYLSHPSEFSPITLRAVKFDQLPTWQQANVMNSLQVFQKSCNVFLRQNPEQSVGSDLIPLKVKDWQEVCHAAADVKPSKHEAQEFFQKWFVPVEIMQQKQVQGLFTGYYVPTIHGSLTKTPKYQVPIYDVPEDLVSVNLALLNSGACKHRIYGRMQDKMLVPYYTRKEIDAGAINGHARIVAWVANKVERQFLEIEGSGVIELDDGTKVYIGYAGQNGAPYTALAGVLINQGIMTKDNQSMQRILSYFKHNPSKVDSILNQNRSFVFFRHLPKDEAIGSQGVGLTPGYSLAVDLQWIPIGAPLWLQTSKLDFKTKHQVNFNRLMVAQDTGGAIRGVVRGDVFWGAGKQASVVAGQMKSPGYYWLLLPRKFATKLLAIS